MTVANDYGYADRGCKYHFRITRQAAPVPPFAPPREYAAALAEKQRAVKQLQSALRSQQLDQAAQSTLERVVQAKFKEWLVTSGRVREVLDLVQLANLADSAAAAAAERRD